MIRTRTRNNRIPNHRLIRRRLIRRRLRAPHRLVPRRSHIDEDLFRVPGKQTGQVGGEIKADAGVFFLLGAIVMRAPLRAVVIVVLACTPN